MNAFQNAVCPVCKQPLGAQDDVVVCPECGAPYHRACYKQVGHCLYEDKHAAGFTYLPEPAPAPEEAGADEAQPFVLCPHCGKGNPADAAACCNCGAPLPHAAAQPPAPARPEAPLYRRPPQDVPPPRDEVPPAGTPQLTRMAEEQLRAMDLAPEDKLDGFSLKEWLFYLGPSAPVYLYAFRRMDQSRHGYSFSLSAAVMGPLYFLYRKMWLWGALALLVKLVCALPDALLIAGEAGVLTLPFAVSVLQRLSTWATYADVAFGVFWGVAAHGLYRRCCRTRMQAVHRMAPDAPPERLYGMLAASGGVSLAGVILAMVLVSVLEAPLVMSLMG